MVQVVGKDEGQVLKVTCRNCASILQFTRSEAKERVYRYYTGGASREMEITCPACGVNVNVTKLCW